MISVVYFATPDIAVPALEVLHNLSEVEVSLVVTNEAKPVGRKKELTPSPVAEKARELGLEVLEVGSMTDEGVYEKLASLDADVYFAFSFGHIFKANILELPNTKFLNIHASLLPKYRGASPLQAALAAGDEKTGVCFMDITAKMDAGAVYSCKEIALDSTYDFEKLWYEVASVGAELCRESFVSICEGSLEGVPQDEDKASYCSIIKKEDGLVDFEAMTATEVFNLWRAYKVWPKIYSFIDSEKIVFGEVLVSDDCPVSGLEAAGSIAHDGQRLFVKCNDAVLEILELQIPGKKMMKTVDFLRGNADIITNKKFNGTIN